LILAENLALAWDVIPLQDKPEDGDIEANLDVSPDYGAGIVISTPVHPPGSPF
jgi:hypothetical protein